ncbi:MAG: mechanosensitive ion channel protein MscS [Firmicutes bacterium HGW-Firmicutes-7]|nr:MAG: mechanosensitive ion channel protein MscS [Firmicutes bacterium HGW-Firmicutes-7]
MKYEIAEWAADYLAIAITFLIILLLSLIGRLITNKVILKALSHFMLNNKVKWDDVILERKVFHKLSRIVPALVIYSFAPVFSAYIEFILQNLAMCYIVIISVSAIDALLNAINDIYRTFESSKNKPIKGYLQVVKIFIYIVAGIVIIATIIGKSPVLLFSGIGALSAVLLLIFKDSILGLVAGIQLSSNDMVRIGDWIEMPKYGADGDVIDISLNTVKVENFDKTITTIPSYALVSDSFKNWRGMTQSGGRRIKRSIYIDMNSITFCTEDSLKDFEQIHYLTKYIHDKSEEIKHFNLVNDIDTSKLINGRHLTNIGVLRVYIETYLKNHPKIHDGMVQIVRQLSPTENGLPLEIYVFVKEIGWETYEMIQSDIFDHILAIVPQFGLRIFQKPAGHDLRNMANKDV